MPNPGTFVAASDRPQHLQALARANEVRLARASLKRDIATGRNTAGVVIRECPWQAETMRLGELLSSQKRWGRTRTRKFLGSLAISENKVISSLTQRQRTLLVAALEAKQSHLEQTLAVESIPHHQLVAA